MLEIRNLNAGYVLGRSVLHGVNIEVAGDDIVAIIGQNGSGKSTLAKSIAGMVPYLDGEISLDGHSLLGKPVWEVADMGIGVFMQGGRIFPNLTVEENLDFVGSYLNHNDAKTRRVAVLEYFPILGKGLKGLLKASHLSGGEQHQLALAMVLMKDPTVLVLDEPSAGLSPVNADFLYSILGRIRDESKRSIVIIEQNVLRAVGFAKRVLLLSEGMVQKEVMADELAEASRAAEFYLSD